MVGVDSRRRSLTGNGRDCQDVLTDQTRARAVVHPVNLASLATHPA